MLIEKKLLELSTPYKKIDYVSLALEEYETKSYLYNLNLAQARIKFRERSSCMKFCRTHTSSDETNIKAMFQCFNCSKVDVLSHWRTCKSYENLRQNKNLEKDEDLMKYYQEIIQIRSSESE